MSSPLYGLLLLVTSVTSTAVKKDPSQVTVTLYYETLCPFCQNFIPNVLTPTFLDDRFGPLFKELNFIPFGIANVVNSTAHKYTCQHEEAECQGNRFHACAIKYIKDKKRLVNFISCLTETIEVDSEEDEDYPVDKCLDKIPDSTYPKIMDCYKSEEGWKLLEQYGRQTKKFFTSGDEFVPYISFNNAKNDDLAMKAIEHLKKVMCKLTGIQHLACSETSEEEEESEDEGSEEETISIEED